MGILSKLTSHKLKAGWKFKTRRPSEIIWKLLISPEGILAGEERDTETKTASLFAIAVSHGNVLWRDVKIDEPWWFNSERATNETLYIQKFRKPDMPEPKGIIALDIHSGRMRWEQPDLSMLFEREGKIFGQREGYGKKDFFSLDSGTGEVLEVHDTLSAEYSVLEPEPDIHSVYSVAIAPNDELFEEIQNVIADVLTTDDLRGTIDFAEYGKYIIFAFHEKIYSNREQLLPIASGFGSLKNHLKVLDKERGEIVYSDEPNSETPYPVPENFFINRGVLIYVKEKREIVGVPLVQ